MRKINLIWIFALFLAIPNTLAYINCTTSACPSGYTDNGVVCSGATCVRNCTVPVCTQSWTQVHSDTAVGFDVDMVDRNDISTSFTPSDTSKCYNFTYDATALDDIDVIMTADTVSPDCDTESIGGFWDDTQRTSPWFSGMNDYIGNVGDPEFDYLVKTMRGHTEEDSDSSYRSKVRVKGGILCANNTVACSRINGGAAICDTDCYNRATIMNVHQGYYTDQGTQDSTLYADLECGDNLGGASDYVDTNRIRNTKYTVYESTTVTENSDQSCDRTHEAPSVSNVRVLPLIPNAGQDLLCNYTYSDPENFTEQNSSYEWWKNSVNQNINSQTLNKNNLTPGDSWYCKATPSDGLLFGTQVQSANTVTIRNATQNPVLYTNNQAVWNNTGYYGVENNVYEFGDELNNALSSCTADAQGFCNISLKFSSDNVGVLNASIESSIYYTETFTLPDVNKFFIKNASGSNIAWFGDAGNIVIKGVLEQNSNFQATSNFAFKIRNNLNDVLIIENNGSMYIDGTLQENQATINSDTNRNDFRVKDSSGNLMININETGYVFLKGTITQNGNP